MNNLLKYSLYGILLITVSINARKYHKSYEKVEIILPDEEIDVVIPESQTERGVSEVKSVKHFNDMLSNNEWIVIKFYSPYCIHCKHYGPEFMEASRHPDMEHHKFIAVNVDEHPELARKHHVGGLPTTIVMHNGKKVDEFGGNTPAKKVVQNVQRVSSK